MVESLVKLLTANFSEMDMDASANLVKRCLGQDPQALQRMQDLIDIMPEDLDDMLTALKECDRQRFEVCRKKFKEKVVQAGVSSRVTLQSSIKKLTSVDVLQTPRYRA